MNPTTPNMGTEHPSPPSDSGVAAGITSPFGTCPTCRTKPVSAIYCSQCDLVLDPPSTGDPFKLFGISPAFALDDEVLSRTYRSMARLVHPDRFVNRGDDIIQKATRVSAELNHAYRVLDDPIRRADFLLESAGGPRATEVRDTPEGFLMDVLTIREEMQQAMAAGDELPLAELRARIMSRKAELMAWIADRLDHLPDNVSTEGHEIRRRLNAARFLEKLLNELMAARKPNTGVSHVPEP